MGEPAAAGGDEDRTGGAPLDRDAGLRLALAATRTGFWQWSAATDRVEWSDEVWSLFGLEPTDAPPSMRDALDLVHEDDRDTVTAALDRAVREGEPYELTFRVPRRRGDGVRWVWVQGHPVAEAGGRPRSVIGLVRDVTEQQAVEAALRESATRVRRIIDGLFVFVGLLEVDGTLVEANQTALAAAGLDAADVLGRRFWDTYWWSWNPEVQERLREAVAAAARGVPSRYDAEVRLSEEARITIDFQLVPLLDDAGRVINLIPSAIDITDRERARRRDALLAGAVNAMEAADTVEERAQALAGSLVPDLGDYVSVELYAPDGRRTTVAVAHADPELEPVLHELRMRHALDVRDPLSLASAREAREPLLVPDVGVLAREHPEGSPVRGLLDRIAPLSYIAAPIVIRGRAIGAVLVGTQRGGRILDIHDLEAASAVSGRAGLALENARLHERDRHIARTLQRSLLPGDLPEVEGMQLAAAYLAAGDGHEVGGDFYDAFRAGDDWVLVIGDVCGKGPEAAQLTALCRHTVRVTALDREEPLDPVRVLGLLNRAILAFQPGSTRFSTAVVARLRPAPGGGATVLLANAAHPPPLAVRTDGMVEALPATGGLLGIDPDWHGTSWEGALAPGEALVLHTDGVTEARRHGLFFGERRLRRVIGHNAGLPARDLVAAVEASVAEFQSGAPLLDDVAILAVCLEGAVVPAADAPVAEHPAMRVSVPTRFEALSGARARVRGWLEGIGAAPDVVDDLVIAVGEALANAVEHAAGDPGCPLELECHMERGDAVIRVRDRGRWRPPVPTPNRGFGLRMIAALTHEASLGHDEGTVLTMRRGILPAGAA